MGKRLRAKGLKGMTITLKLKRSDFKQITRSTTLEKPTSSSNAIYEKGEELLKGIDFSRKFRLIGIGVSNLVHVDEEQRQLSLFEGLDPKGRSWENVEKAMDDIKKRFGRDAIKRGICCQDH